MCPSPTPPKDLFLTGTLLGLMPVGGAHIFFLPHALRLSERQVSTGTLGKLAWEQASKAALSPLSKHFVVETLHEAESFPVPQGCL